MKILFVSSANKGKISPIVSSQGKSIEDKGITVVYFGIQGKGIKGYLSNIPRLRREIKEVDPDLIHAHYSLSGFVVALCMANKPVIVSLMGSDIQAGFAFSNAIKLFSRTFWNAVIVKSCKMKSALGLPNVHVIPNGVDLNLFKQIDNPGLKAKFGFDEQNINILFLAAPGRVEKNYKLATDALKLVKTQNARLNVRYNLPHSDIPKVINASDIILLTSKWEGSPNVVKEAMACNRPIVSTDVGDVKWLLGNEEGNYITGFEPQDVAKKIDLACQYCRNIGKTNCRMRLKKLKLSDSEISEKIVNLYKCNI